MRCRAATAERTRWGRGGSAGTVVVFVVPVADEHLGLKKCGEDLESEWFIAHAESDRHNW
jgi:hypothetical protein